MWLENVLMFLCCFFALWQNRNLLSGVKETKRGSENMRELCSKTWTSVCTNNTILQSSNGKLWNLLIQSLLWSVSPSFANEFPSSRWGSGKLIQTIIYTPKIPKYEPTTQNQEWIDRDSIPICLLPRRCGSLGCRQENTVYPKRVNTMKKQMPPPDSQTYN